MRNPGRRQLRAIPRAFTLFETLVALGVSVILSAALYVAIDLYARLTTAGREDSERAQIARAALRQIELDLHAVLYVSPLMATATSAVPTPQSGSGSGSGSGSAGGSGGSSSGGSGGSGGSGSGSGGGGGSGGGSGGSGSSAGGSSGSSSSGSSSSGSSTSGSASNTNANTQSTTVVPPATGVFGDSMHLMMSVNRPTYPVLATSMTAGQLIAPLALPNDARAVQFSVGTPMGGTAGLVSSTGGLLRTRAPVLSLDTAITSGTLEGAGTTELLAPEVIAIQFQYFDGTQWQTSWDSAAMQALPRAVDVTIQVATQAELRRQGAYGSMAVGEIYRMVIPMVLSTPIDLQEAEAAAQ